MPKADFFRQLGLFVVPDFLSFSSGPELYEAIASSPVEKALVLRYTGEACVDETVRRVDNTLIPKVIRDSMSERLTALIPALENHFKINLAGCEPPQCLIYNPGGYFKTHRDGDREGGNESTRKRRISTVVFLNRQSPEPAEDTYGEGFLTFYGLLDGPKWERCGLALEAEPGLLVAFPSDKLHEVTPVTHGRRYTLVTWYYGPDSDSDSAPDVPA